MVSNHFLPTQHTWLPPLLALLLSCLIVSDASSKESVQNLTDQWVEQAAGPLIKDRTVDGMSIGYLEGKHYGVVHLGSANRTKQKATHTTLYEVGSISKVFTSLLLADAVVQGEIDLQAAAATENAAGIQFPSYEGTPITWANLATHRSGLPRLPSNMSLLEFRNPYRNYDSQLAAAFLHDYQLPRKPGDSYEYSNFAASVLGYLVAEKANLTYEKLLRERIAGPLKMTDCTTEPSAEQKKRHATPHSKYSAVTSAWTFADLPGAGGVRASIRDMMRFARANLYPPKGEIGEAIDVAWKQHAAGDDSGPALGLGWHIMGDGQTRWHNGQTGGSHASLFINRENNTAVVILCNTAAGDTIDQLAIKMIRKAAGHDVEATEEPAQDKAEDRNVNENTNENLAADPQHRRRLEGRYQLAPNFIFTVRDRDGRMMVAITNQATQEVFPDSPTHWSYRGVEATLEFELPKQGPATGLILHQNGLEQKARRVK